MNRSTITRGYQFVCRGFATECHAFEFIPARTLAAAITTLRGRRWSVMGAPGTAPRMNADVLCPECDRRLDSAVERAAEQVRAEPSRYVCANTLRAPRP